MPALSFVCRLVKLDELAVRNCVRRCIELIFRQMLVLSIFIYTLICFCNLHVGDNSLNLLLVGEEFQQPRGRFARIPIL